jgi:hypothetical protein
MVSDKVDFLKYKALLLLTFEESDIFVRATGINHDGGISGVENWELEADKILNRRRL